MHVARDEDTGEREAVTMAQTPSNESRFLAEIDVHLNPRGGPSPHSPQKPLTEAVRARYLRDEPLIQAGSPVVSTVLSEFTRDGMSQSELLMHIFKYCSERIARDSENAPVDAASVLSQGGAGTLGRARAMVALCRASHLPARIVGGFVLDRVRYGIRPHVWMETYTEEEWVPFDPQNGHFRDFPPGYLPVHRDEPQIVRAIGAAAFRAQFSAYRLQSPLGVPASPRGPWLDILDLTRLPPGSQRISALLLLFPVGALLTTAFRNLIGVQTFGTFAPSLLALSFVHADWRTGLMVLIVVMAVGLAGRAVLDRLRLLLVARLSVVVTLVVLSLAFAVSVLDYYRLTPAAQTVLLPMVIMTMTIERFYVSSEEDGLPYALMVLAGTFAVALCCFVVLRWEKLGALLLRFPEGELFIVAALILLGRYTGYRLTDLWRFRDIARDSHPEDVR
jgi:hypothetical protein